MIDMRKENLYGDKINIFLFFYLFLIRIAEIRFNSK